MGLKRVFRVRREDKKCVGAFFHFLQGGNRAKIEVLLLAFRKINTAELRMLMVGAFFGEGLQCRITCHKSGVRYLA